MLALVCISWIFHCFFLSYFICPIQIMTSLTVPANILWESHVLVIWRPPYVLLVAVRMFYRRRQWYPTPVLWPGKYHGWRSLVGCSPWGREESDTTERLHFHFRFPALEKAMATHSSILAWRIPGMGEPGGLPSVGSHRVGHDWRDSAAAAAGCSIAQPEL